MSHRSLAALLGAAVLFTIATATPARAAVVTVSDPIGDSTASADGLYNYHCIAGCPDLVAVTVAEEGKNLAVTLQSATPWGSVRPQVWFWQATPDTGPPDSYVDDRNMFDEPGYSVSAPSPTVIVYRVPGVRVVGSTDARVWRFRWRAVIRRAGPYGHLESQPYDAAPDSGSAEFAFDDADSDGEPDSWDPCPTAPHAEVTGGWIGDQLYGCPPKYAPPFDRSALVPAARASSRKLKALWRNPTTRVRALRHRRLDIPFTVPAGAVHVSMAVRPAFSRGPWPRSVFGGGDCRAGKRCVVRLKLAPKTVRAYRNRKLRFDVSVSVGMGRDTIHAGWYTELRMPLNNGSR